jgi:hypothetical protein
METSQLFVIDGRVRAFAISVWYDVFTDVVHRHNLSTEPVVQTDMSAFVKKAEIVSPSNGGLERSGIVIFPTGGSSMICAGGSRFPCRDAPAGASLRPLSKTQSTLFN